MLFVSIGGHEPSPDPANPLGVTALFGRERTTRPFVYKSVPVIAATPSLHWSLRSCCPGRDSNSPEEAATMNTTTDKAFAVVLGVVLVAVLRKSR